MNGAKRSAAPEKYPEVMTHLETVQRHLEELRTTLQGGKVLKYKDVETLGNAVASLVSRAASACW